MIKTFEVIKRIPPTIWYLVFNTIFGLYCYIVACIHNIGNIRNFILLRVIFQTNHAIIESMFSGEELQTILKKYERNKK